MSMISSVLKPGPRETYGGQAMDVFASAHSDEEDQPDSSRNTTAGVHWIVH